jgi:hypothetical protein
VKVTGGVETLAMIRLRILGITKKVVLEVRVVKAKTVINKKVVIDSNRLQLRNAEVMRVILSKLDRSVSVCMGNQVVARVTTT